MRWLSRLKKRNLKLRNCWLQKKISEMEPKSTLLNNWRERKLMKLKKLNCKKSRSNNYLKTHGSSYLFSILKMIMRKKKKSTMMSLKMEHYSLFISIKLLVR